MTKKKNFFSVEKYKINHFLSFSDFRILRRSNVRSKIEWEKEREYFYDYRIVELETGSGQCGFYESIKIVNFIHKKIRFLNKKNYY